MRLPSASLQIHFNVATHGRFVVKLDNGSAKIGSALKTEEAGVKYFHRAPVQRGEAVAPEPLLLPEDLEETLRGRLQAFVES